MPQKSAASAYRLIDSRRGRVAVSLIVLAIVVGAVCYYRSNVMQWGLEQFLTKTSLSAPKLSGLRFDSERAELAAMEFSVETGAGPLAAKLEDVRANYDFRVPKVEAITVNHAKLSLAYRPTEKSRTEGGGLSNAPVLPLDSLSVENLELDIATPWGLTRFAGQAEIRHGATGAIEATFRDKQHTLHAELGSGFDTLKLSVERIAAGKVLELNAEGLDRPNRRMALHAGVGPLIEWLSSSLLVPDTLRAKMAAAGLNGVTPALSAMTLEVNAETADSFEHAKGRVVLTRNRAYLASADLSGAIRPIDLDIDAHLDMTAADVFELLKPWSPESVQGWQISGGQVLAGTTLSWSSGQAGSGAAHLQVSGLNLTTGGLRLENADVEADIADLARRSATLSATAPKLAMGKNISAGDLVVKAHYLENALILDRAALAMLGGLLELLPGEIDFAQRPMLLTLQLQDVDLAQLLASLDYPALSGTGTVSGQLPLRLAADAIELQDGLLAGMRPGVIRYRGPSADQDNIAFKALRNLAYHSLQAKLNYRPDGAYRLGLRLEGSNPEVLSGHPLAFNLNVSGQLPELLRRGIAAGDFERAIMEQANTGPAKPRSKTPHGDSQTKPPSAD